MAWRGLITTWGWGHWWLAAAGLCGLAAVILLLYRRRARGWLAWLWAAGLLYCLAPPEPLAVLAPPQVVQLPPLQKFLPRPFPEAVEVTTTQPSRQPAFPPSPGDRPGSAAQRLADTLPSVGITPSAQPGQKAALVRPGRCGSLPAAWTWSSVPSILLASGPLGPLSVAAAAPQAVAMHEVGSALNGLESH